MAETHYYGITLGPIYKTLGYARKTRELWSASYLFSYLMRGIIHTLKEKGATFIMPYSEDEIRVGDDTKHLFRDKYEAGLFPDRCIFHFEGNDPGLEAVNEAVQAQKLEVINQMTAHLTQQYDENIDLKDATAFLEQYFQVYLAALPFAEGTPNQQVTRELFEALDVLELQPQFIQEEKKHYLKGFLAKASFRKADHSFLLEAAREMDRKDSFRFHSIIEIAAAGFISRMGIEQEVIDKIGDEETENIVESLKERDDPDSPHFRTYHKYMALVHIDGDNFGKIVKALDNDHYLDFSERLTRFSLQVQQAVTDYGGMPVYIGGDDALFFAPLRYHTEERDEHIFDLLDKIDGLFAENFGDMIEELKDKLEALPSLSAGVAVAYHKHPLVEALDTSRSMLFGKAKGFETVAGHKKNAVAFHVLKHSGMQFGAVLSKDDDAREVYDGFKKLVRANIEEGQFLTSVIHTLAKHRGLLAEMGKDKERVGHFIDNQFNEPEHEKYKSLKAQVKTEVEKADPSTNHQLNKVGQEEDKGFLDHLKDFIPAIYKTYHTTDAEQTLYGLLRMVKFLNRDDTE